MCEYSMAYHLIYSVVLMNQQIRQSTELSG